MPNANKKQLIIQAALRVMAEKGYEKASIKDIAGEAGITPGLIHYYFHNKEEILMELLMNVSHTYTQDMQHLRQIVPSPEQLAAAAMDEPKKRVQTEPEWYQLRYELFALCLRNENLAPGVRELLENARVGILRILQDVFRNDAEDFASLSAILLACFDGLALQKLVDPWFDLEKVYAMLEKMVTLVGGKH